MTPSSGNSWLFRSAPTALPPKIRRPEDAQRWCNFVILVPKNLPADCRLASPGMLRKEAAPGNRNGGVAGRPDWTQANPCSFVIEINGKDRKLRIKQFLYDWAPPATDHPCLWANKDKPFSIDGRIGWIGTDFKGNHAASAFLSGTMCEIRVLEGNFDDEELALIYRGLTAADPDAETKILQTPFADLCYSARYNGPLIDVPFGLWRYRTKNLNRDYHWSPEFHYSFDAGCIPPAPSKWELDSCRVLGYLQHQPDETDALYTLGNRDRFLWSRVVLNQKLAPFAMPPEKDGHPCQTAVRSILGTEVHHAWINDQYGPHDFVWGNEGLMYMMQFNSAENFTVDAAVGLLKDAVNSIRTI